jgi:hypothetical protein
LKRSPFLLRISSLASSSGLGGESHASSLAGKKAIKALGAGGGGGGASWRASSLAGRNP